MGKLIENEAWFNVEAGLSGDNVVEKRVHLSQIAGLFQSSPEEVTLRDDPLVYRVNVQPPPEGIHVGALNFGCTCLKAGTVDGEYFLTGGHVHALRDRAEYYWGLRGTGFLLLHMVEEGKSWAESMTPGSLHYVPPGAAHRLVNSGDTDLVVGACWPADAGHEYEPVRLLGMGIRVLEGPDGPYLQES